MLVVFLALVVGPVVAGKYVPLKKIPMSLLQPVGYNNNDTFSTVTGGAINPGLGAKGPGVPPAPTA